MCQNIPESDSSNWSWGWSGASTPWPSHTSSFLAFDKTRLRSELQEQIFTQLELQTSSAFLSFRGKSAFKAQEAIEQVPSHLILAMTGGISRPLEAPGWPVLVCGPAPHRAQAGHRTSPGAGRAQTHISMLSVLRAQPFRPLPRAGTPPCLPPHQVPSPARPRPQLSLASIFLWFLKGSIPDLG